MSASIPSVRGASSHRTGRHARPVGSDPSAAAAGRRRCARTGPEGNRPRPGGRFGWRIPARISRTMPPRRPAHPLVVLSTLLLAVSSAQAGEKPPAATAFRDYVRVVERPYLRVGLTVTVIDRQGQPVRDLSRDEFTVTEDGEAVELADFAREGDRRDRPLSVAVLLDLSYSMARPG